MSDLDTINSTFLQPLRIFNDVVNGIAQIHPYAQMALSVLTTASQLILSQVNLDTGIRDLLCKVGQTYQFIMEDDALSKISMMQDKLEQLAHVVQESAQFIAKYSETTNFWNRLRKNIFSETNTKILAYNTALDGLMQQFRDQELRDTHVKVHKMWESHGLDVLEYASGVGINMRKSCLEGTRTEILTDIVDWMVGTDPNTPRVFWLHGQDLGILGSCFCFTRVRENEGLHDKLVTTIARDLADRDLRLRPLLAEVIATHRSLKETKDVMQHWKKYILETLSRLKGPMIGNVVVVIDALDESGGPATREDILDILATRTQELPTTFRILLTSRPLRDISSVLQGVTHVKAVSLDDISAASTTNDIRLYVSKRLDREKNIQGDDIKEIAKRSDGLFEWARLACEFIKPQTAGETAKERFEDLIARTSGEGKTLLDSMYNMILTNIITKKPKTLLRFRSVMRQVLYTLEPLPIPALSAIREGFSSPEDCYDVGVILDYMGSLLGGTSDRLVAIRPLHASFFDYLTDPSRSGDFFIDKSDVHHDIALGTFHVLRSNLRFNICGLKTSYLRNSEIPGLAEAVAQNIPHSLSYSCRFWAVHLREAGFLSDLAGCLKDFLGSEWIFFWMEAMGLLKTIGEVQTALVVAATWLKGYTSGFEGVLAVIKDAIKFVRHFASIIQESTPHLYLSALPFSPATSILALQLAPKFPNVARIAMGHRQTWPNSRVLEDHTNWVLSVVFSPDGKHVASCSRDQTIRCWDVETGTQLGRPLSGHTHSVFSLAFAPDGKHIASGSRDKTIRVWDVEQGVQVGNVMQGHTGAVNSVVFSADGKVIASGSNGNTIRLWHVESGVQVGTPLLGHKGAVTSVNFLPEKRYLLSGSRDKTIQLWDVEVGALVGNPICGHTGPVFSVAISSDGRWAASAAADQTIRLWDLLAATQVGNPLEGHASWVLSVAFSPDGKYLVSSSYDLTIQLWDVQMGTTVGKPLYGHTASILSVAFAPQGEYIVSGSHDHTVRLWDVETYFQGSTEETFQVSNAIQRHTDGVESVTFSLDGSKVLSGLYDTTIQVWDIEVAALEQMSLEGHSAAVKSIAVSLDGKHVASGSIDGTVQVWNLQTGTPVGEPLRGHLDSVNSVAFSPDGKFIVSGSTDASIRLWNVESKNQINGPFQGHIHGVMFVKFSQDGKYVFSGSYDGTIQLWNLDTQAQERINIIGKFGVTDALAFSVDGKYIASGTNNGTVQLWDAKSVSQIGLPMDGHHGAILSIAFSPNGKYIVSGSNDKTVRVWEIETSAQVGSPLLGHTDAVRSVAFSPDGKCILSGSFDQTIRIWCKDNNPEPTIKFSSVASHALKDAHRLFADMPNSTGYLNDLVTLSENGWIIGPNDQLLLWVPPTYSSLLYSTWNTLVLPRSGPELDLSEMAHGSAWELCYIGHNS